MNYNGEPFYDGYGSNQGYSHITKKQILDYIVMALQPTDIVQVDSFETPRTRHICPNAKFIQVLDKQVFTIQTLNGPINIECFFCPNCGKLIINKESLDFM